MKRSLLLGVAILALGAGSANAATTLSWGSGDTGLDYVVNFNGFIGSPDSPTVIPGLTAQITYELTSVSDAGKTWTFSYAIANTSSAPTTASRISSFGFDTSPLPLANGASSTGTYPFASTPGPNIPNNIGTVDVCFTQVSQGTCTGNGGGLTFGQSGSGSLSLMFGTGQSQLDFTSLYVRYQSISPDTISGSASGVPTSVVPEPATWAMMIIGFTGVGAMVRRSRRLAGQVAA